MDLLGFDLPRGFCSGILHLFFDSLAFIILAPFWTSINAGRPFEKNNLLLLCVAVFGHEPTGRCLLSGKDFPPPLPTHHQGPKEEAGKILSTIGDLDMIEVKPGEKNLCIDAAQVNFWSRFWASGPWEGFSSQPKHFFSIWWAFTQLATRQQERPVVGGTHGLLARTCRLWTIIKETWCFPKWVKILLKCCSRGRKMEYVEKQT